MAEQQSRQGQQSESTMARSESRERGLAARAYEDPFSLLDSMFERLQRDFFGMSLFDASLAGWPGDRERSGPRVPRVRAHDTGDSLVLTAELPGIKPADVQVELGDDVLTIRAEAGQEEESEGARAGRYIGFHRQLRLPEDLDADQVEASYSNGVLTIRLPRRTRRESARQIPITTESRGSQPTTEPPAKAA